MKKIIASLIFVAVSFGICKAENGKPSPYKIDETSIDAQFEQGQDITTGVSQLFISSEFSKIASDDKRVIAGVLGIFCGSLGLHRFYMGHTKAGLAYLGFTLVCGGGATVGAVVCFPLAFGVPLVFVPGIIDGIIYLFATDDEFQSKYAHNEKVIQWGEKKDKK